jgi:hypothetical protein
VLPRRPSRAVAAIIAVVRVAPRRFGQLRILAAFTGAGCSADAAPHGPVTKAMATVLPHATSHLRVARVHSAS